MARHARTQPLPTSYVERRLIAAARDGDAHAQHRLLKLYEPMALHVGRKYFLPGAEAEDLAQAARLAIIEATRRWDPHRGVPFSSFAWMCATREARNVVDTACANKHKVLTSATSLDLRLTRARQACEHYGEHWTQLPGAMRREAHLIRATEVAGPRDNDPVAKTLAREQLELIVGEGRNLSHLERRALGLAATGYTHQEIAAALRVRSRAVNNALQRARGKLKESLAA